jgi:hypothetical protein
MTKLMFNDTTYEFRLHYGDNNISLHILVDGVIRKVKQQCSVSPQSLQECLELLTEYEL